MPQKILSDFLDSKNSTRLMLGDIATQEIDHQMGYMTVYRDDTTPFNQIVQTNWRRTQAAIYAVITLSNKITTSQPNVSEANSSAYLSQFTSMPLASILNLTDELLTLKNKKLHPIWSEYSEGERAFSLFLTLLRYNKEFCALLDYFRYNYNILIKQPSLYVTYNVAISDYFYMEYLAAINMDSDYYVDFNEILDTYKVLALNSDVVSSFIEHGDELTNSNFSTIFNNLLTAAKYQSYIATNNIMALCNSTLLIYGYLHTLERLTGLSNTITEMSDRLTICMLLNQQQLPNNKHKGTLDINLNIADKNALKLDSTLGHVIRVASDSNIKLGSIMATTLSHESFFYLKDAVEELNDIAKHLAKDSLHLFSFILIGLVIIITRLLYEEKDIINKLSPKELVRVLTAVVNVDNAHQPALYSNAFEITVAKLGNINDAVQYYASRQFDMLSQPEITLRQQCINAKIDRDGLGETALNYLYDGLNLKDKRLSVISAFNFTDLYSYNEVKENPFFSNNYAADMDKYIDDWVVNTMSSLVTLLDILNCKDDIHTMYNNGMEYVYKEYPFFESYLRTAYSLYPLGIIACYLGDKNIALDYFKGNQPLADLLFTLGKKARKQYFLQIKEQQEEATRKKLAETAKLRAEQQQKALEEKQQRALEEENKAKLQQQLLEEQQEADQIMDRLKKNAWAGYTYLEQYAAYIRYLQNNYSHLEAAKLVEEEFKRRKEEEDALLAEWEREEEEKKQQLIIADIEKRVKEEKNKQEEYAKKCNLAFNQLQDTIKGRAIFTNILLSTEAQETAPKLTLLQMCNLFPDLLTQSKMLDKMQKADSDIMPEDILYEEILKCKEIYDKRVIDPLDKEVMSSARALATKHGVTEEQVSAFIHAGKLNEYALVMSPADTARIAAAFNADRIVYDRKGMYIVCKDDYILPVSYKHLVKVKQKLKQTRKEDKN